MSTDIALYPSTPAGGDDSVAAGAGAGAGAGVTSADTAAAVSSAPEEDVTYDDVRRDSVHGLFVGHGADD